MYATAQSRDAFAGRWNYPLCAADVRNRNWNLRGFPKRKILAGRNFIKSLTNKAVPLLIGVLLAPAFLAPVQAQRTLTMGKLAILSPSHI